MAYGQDYETANKPAGEQLKNSGAALKRDKYWGELSIEEKIERLRTLCKALSYTLDVKNNELYDLKTFIWEHAHEENGEVVVKVKQKNRHRLENRSDYLTKVNKVETPQSDEVYI